MTSAAGEARRRPPRARPRSRRSGVGGGKHWERLASFTAPVLAPHSLITDVDAKVGR